MSKILCKSKFLSSKQLCTLNTFLCCRLGKIKLLFLHRKNDFFPFHAECLLRAGDLGLDIEMSSGADVPTRRAAGACSRHCSDLAATAVLPLSSYIQFPSCCSCASLVSTVAVTLPSCRDTSGTRRYYW